MSTLTEILEAVNESYDKINTTCEVSKKYNELINSTLKDSDHSLHQARELISGRFTKEEKVKINETFKINGMDAPWRENSYPFNPIK